MSEPLTPEELERFDKLVPYLILGDKVHDLKAENEELRQRVRSLEAALEECEFQAVTQSDKDRIAQLEDAIRLHEDWYTQMLDVANFWMKRAEHYKKKAES